MSSALEHVVVAVDGTSGSGKSSTCRGVASRLGLRYLDTGAQFRAVTWFMLSRGVGVVHVDAPAEHEPRHRAELRTGVEVAEPEPGRDAPAGARLARTGGAVDRNDHGAAHDTILRCTKTTPRRMWGVQVDSTGARTSP